MKAVTISLHLPQIFRCSTGWHGRKFFLGVGVYSSNKNIIKV